MYVITKYGMYLANWNNNRYWEYDKRKAETFDTKEYALYVARLYGAIVAEK